MKKLGFLYLLLPALIASLWLARPAQSAGARFSKVMIVILENTNYSDAMKQPFLGKLAREGALLSNFHAEAHPSQPNYLALVSGDMQGCHSDSDIDVDGQNITDLLDAKGLTWKVYAEAYPGGCYKGTRKGNYVRKHNPFISFQSIQDDTKKCGHIVDSSQLAQDVAKGTLPHYAFYIPDLKNDGHDTGPQYADTWYSHAFGPLIGDSRFMDGMLLVTTFDENDYGEPSNQIYTSLFGAGVKAGAVSNGSYSHYSLLRLIEDQFGLGTLGGHDEAASPILDVWVGK